MTTATLPSAGPFSVECPNLLQQHLDHLVVVTPDSLTKKQRQLFEELADSLGPADIPPPQKWR